MSSKANATVIEECRCKYCGRKFVQPRRKGRPLIFCDDMCREKWNKGYYKRKHMKIKQKKARLSNIYVVPAFHGNPDISRLVRTIIQMQMVVPIEGKEDD